MRTSNGLDVPTGWGTTTPAPRRGSVREQRRCGQPVGGGRFTCPALGTITFQVAVAGHEDRAMTVRCCSGHLIATVARYEDQGMEVWQEGC